MKITEVRIFPTESKDGKLKAFATMTFDDWFVVRNVKVIQGTNGLFVAMPSRKAMDACGKCNFKNAVGSKYCNQCGSPLEQRQPSQETSGDLDKQGNHMDIAHPITQECRLYIQEKILEAFNKEATVGSPRGESRSERPRAKGRESAPARPEINIEEEASRDIEL
ncbi:MAG: septation protein SpoVG family protein [Candidatus Omnitrophica bacterium]|nr:septation protein SpoVG family protein [Candidatus Omnitrophota bacterium]